MDYKRTPLVERWALDSPIRNERVSQCFFCKHNLPKGTCVAFPEGVPREIRKNFFIHNKPYEGDKGLLFEARKDEYKNIQFEPMRRKSLGEIIRTDKKRQ